MRFLPRLIRSLRALSGVPGSPPRASPAVLIRRFTRLLLRLNLGFACLLPCLNLGFARLLPRLIRGLVRLLGGNSAGLVGLLDLHGLSLGKEPVFHGAFDVQPNLTAVDVVGRIDQIERFAPLGT